MPLQHIHLLCLDQIDSIPFNSPNRDVAKIFYPILSSFWILVKIERCFAVNAGGFNLISTSKSPRLPDPSFMPFPETLRIEPDSTFGGTSILIVVPSIVLISHSHPN